MTKRNVPELEFPRAINDLLRAGCPIEFITALRAFHNELIGATDLLEDALRWSGGKEHFMADEAFESLIYEAGKLRDMAQRAMLAESKERRVAR